MIAEVSRALEAYRRLDGVGRRLFREELGLVRVQQAGPRRRRTPKSKSAEAAFLAVREAATTIEKKLRRKNGAEAAVPGNPVPVVQTQTAGAIA